MAYEIKDPNAPATRKQLWALFCITKEDHRGKGLTKGEASKLIDELGGKGKKKGKGKKATPKVDKAWKYVELLADAIVAGNKALAACTPNPMIVTEHESPFDDNSPVKNSWYVADGACGFAWVNVKCKGEGLKFINALKKLGKLDRWRKDSYYGGYTFWVREGNQSIAKKEAFANAFADVLREAGINCYANSRLD